MKICFIGLGSIGKRHLSNIKLIAKEKEIELEIHALRSKKNSQHIQGVKKEFYSFSELDNDYDAIFICNPTSLHYNTIQSLKNNGRFFFIEKPIFDHYITDLFEFDDIKKFFYVACPLRYCGTLQYIKDNFDMNKAISCRSICSTYLPDWRKGIDYRNIYSSHKDQGGGVIIDLIHEMDYLVHLFGIPKRIQGFYGKFSNLEIDSEDLAVYIAEFDNLLGELHLDYFGKVRKREVEIYFNDEIVLGDIDNNVIHMKQANKVIDLHEDINQRYIREMNHFIDIIEGKAENDNDIMYANSILKFAQSIEEENKYE